MHCHLDPDKVPWTAFHEALKCFSWMPVLLLSRALCQYSTCVDLHQAIQPAEMCCMCIRRRSKGGHGCRWRRQVNDTVDRGQGWLFDEFVSMIMGSDIVVPAV